MKSKQKIDLDELDIKKAIIRYVREKGFEAGDLVPADVRLSSRRAADCPEKLGFFATLEIEVNDQ